MADIRINALATTAASTASDDFVAVDGSANGTRKLSAYSPTFGGNLTVSGTGTFNGSSVAFANSAAGSGPNIKFENIGGSTQLSETASSSFYFKAYSHNFLSLAGTSLMALSNTGNLTVSGGTITGGTSGLSLASGGTNQNITLTPSGTGATIIAGSNSAATFGGSTAVSIIRNTNATAGAFNTLFFVNKDNFGSAIIATKQTNNGNNGDNLHFVTKQNPGASWNTGMVLTTNDNLLIGTTTDSGNGRLQLADHTTSAGGIGFGTVTSLYASSVSGCLELAAASGTTGGFKLYNTTNQRGQFVYSGTDVYIDASTLTGQLILRTNGSTTALTLDSSQNATFAGNITVDKATPAILVKRGANTQNGQIQFATGASGDFAIGNRGTSDSDLHIYNYGLSADSVTISKNTSAVTFAGSIAIGNTVQTAASVASTHKVTIVIGGVTYYLLATNI